MRIPIYQVDAFTGTVFSGNPAAVCPLDRWLADPVLQAIAAENNLSETAYFVRNGDGYDLRWFTPAHEIDLCGHATLATAFVIFERLDKNRLSLTFNTKSGPLTVRREAARLSMDFPARPPERCEAPPALESGLGKRPVETWKARDYMAVFARSDLAPAREMIAELRAGVSFAAARGRVERQMKLLAGGRMQTLVITATMLRDAAGQALGASHARASARGRSRLEAATSIASIAGIES